MSLYTKVAPTFAEGSFLACQHFVNETHLSVSFSFRYIPALKPPASDNWQGYHFSSLRLGKECLRFPSSTLHAGLSWVHYKLSVALLRGEAGRGLEGPATSVRGLIYRDRSTGREGDLSKSAFLISIPTIMDTVWSVFYQPRNIT